MKLRDGRGCPDWWGEGCSDREIDVAHLERAARKGTEDPDLTDACEVAADCPDNALEARSRALVGCGLGREPECRASRYTLRLSLFLSGRFQEVDLEGATSDILMAL